MPISSPAHACLNRGADRLLNVGFPSAQGRAEQRGVAAQVHGRVLVGDAGGADPGRSVCAWLTEPHADFTTTRSSTIACWPTGAGDGWEVRGRCGRRSALATQLSGGGRLESGSSRPSRRRADITRWPPLPHTARASRSPTTCRPCGAPPAGPGNPPTKTSTRSAPQPPPSSATRGRAQRPAKPDSAQRVERTPATMQSASLAAFCGDRQGVSHPLPSDRRLGRHAGAQV
jgi:hypothetical protein